MNLQDILIDAGIGFAGGFGIGLSKITTIRRERADFIESTLPLLSERERSEGDVNSEEILEQLDNMREYEKRRWVLLPFCYSWVYSLGAGIALPQHGGALENMAISIPAAYVGKIAGSAVRNVLRGRIRKDLEILKKMGLDRENVLEYVPEDKRRDIQCLLADFERMILEGKDEDLGIESPHNPLSKLRQTITSDKRLYNRPLIEWSQNEVSRLTQRATLQRDLMQFYEQGNIGGVGIIGDPEKTKVRIVDIKEGRIIIYMAEFSEVRMRSYDERGLASIESLIPRLEIDEEEGWNRDYRSLAERILNCWGEYTIITMKSPEGTTDFAKAIVATEVFLPAFYAYHKSKEKTE